MVAEFIEFRNREGPQTIDGETRRVGEPSRAQGIAVRFNNRGQRSLGSYHYELTYRDRHGSPIPITARHGTLPRDSDWVLTRVDIVEPGASKEIVLRANHGPIPPAAVSADVEFVEICEAELIDRGVRQGPCWWRRPE